MSKLLSLLMSIVVIITTPIVAQGLSAQDQATPEDLAWDEVDGMESPALEAFLKKFPNGEHTKDAQLYLSFHRKIAALQNEQEQPGFVIPLSEFGDRWESWEARRPERGALGLFSKKTDTGATLGIFSPLGGPNTISFDEYGKPVIPTGDGSIVAIRTNGLQFEWVEPVSVRTPGDEPLYFAVIRDVGLVYLHGQGTVYLGEKQFSLPEANNQGVERRTSAPTGGLATGGLGTILGISVALLVLALVVWYLISRKRHNIDSGV